MKSYLLLFFFFPVLLLGQRAKVSWGSDFKEKKRPNFKTHFIQSDAEHHYFLIENDYQPIVKPKSRYTVLKSDFQNKVIDNAVSELFIDDKKIQFSKIVHSNNKIYALGFRISSSKAYCKLLISEFTNGKFGPAKEIHEHSFKAGNHHVVTDLHKITEVECTTTFSSDKSKMVFANQHWLYDKKREKDKIQLAVFDDNLKELWSKTQDFEYNDDEFIANRAIVSNDGKDIFLTGALNTSRKKASYDYKIFHITDSNMEEYQIKPDENDHQILSLVSMYNDKKKTLYFTGFYKVLKKREVGGIYTGEFNLDQKEVRNLTFVPFSEKEKKTLYKKGDDYNLDINIVNHRKLSNGNIQIIARHGTSRYKHFKLSNFGHEFYPTSTKYDPLLNNKSFVIYTLDSQGFFLNKKIVARDWTQSGLMMKPCVIINDNDDTYLIYRTKVTKKDKEKYKVKGFSYPLTKVFKIDSTGKVGKPKLAYYGKTEKFLIRNNEGFCHENKIIFGGASIPTKGTGLIGVGDRKRTTKFGSINLEKFK